MRIDLNCDLGESFGRWELGEDEGMMRSITSANVACGFHAGDPQVIDRTVRLAARYGVGVGAHPGLPDLVGFGRRDMHLTPEESFANVLYQIGAVAAFCRANRVPLRHVKTHGQLGNMAFRDMELAGAVVRAIRSFDAELFFICQPFSVMGRLAVEAGLKVAWEVYADRAYRPDGSLVPRREPGAVIHDPAEASDRVAEMVRTGQIRAADGSVLKTPVHSICVHGDTANAPAIAAQIRARLERAGIQILPLGA